MSTARGGATGGLCSTREEITPKPAPKFCLALFDFEEPQPVRDDYLGAGAPVGDQSTHPRGPLIFADQVLDDLDAQADPVNDLEAGPHVSVKERQVFAFGFRLHVRDLPIGLPENGVARLVHQRWLFGVTTGNESVDRVADRPRGQPRCASLEAGRQRLPEGVDITDFEFPFGFGFHLAGRPGDDPRRLFGACAGGELFRLQRDFRISDKPAQFLLDAGPVGADLKAERDETVSPLRLDFRLRESRGVIFAFRTLFAMLSPEEAAAAQRVGEAMSYRSLLAGEGASGAFAVPIALDPTILISSAGVQNPLRELASVTTVNSTTWKGVASEGVEAHFRGLPRSTQPLR